MSRWNLPTGSSERDLRLSSLPLSFSILKQNGMCPIRPLCLDYWPASTSTPSDSLSVPSECEVLAREQ